MTKALAPAFQWYPKDILTSARVAELSLEEEGAYRRAIDYCWLNGSLPNDPERLARVIGKGASILVATVVQAMFTPDPNDTSRLIHDRLESEREKQEKWREKSAEGGRKSAETRKRKGLRQLKGGSQMAEPPYQPNGNSSVSSLHTLSTNVERENGATAPRPKKGSRIPEPFLLTSEMREYARERAPEIDVVIETEKFVNYWRAKSGRDATKVDWTATWRNWILKAKEFVPSTKAPEARPKSGIIW